jgi:hypothetical protein
MDKLIESPFIVQFELPVTSKKYTLFPMEFVDGGVFFFSSFFELSLIYSSVLGFGALL